MRVFVDADNPEGVVAAGSIAKSGNLSGGLAIVVDRPLGLTLDVVVLDRSPCDDVVD
ncbi:hypothetical protein [Antrihabitans spumae]|uniref:Uncharacterized protein n=1 Tax=Antrihabitans spumae TaxID=3373370 RepID=A0ABW7KLP3_9NOCA